jgi:hypothetical protein
MLQEQFQFGPDLLLAEPARAQHVSENVQASARRTRSSDAASSNPRRGVCDLLPGSMTKI